MTSQHEFSRPNPLATNTNPMPSAKVILDCTTVDSWTSGVSNAPKQLQAGLMPCKSVRFASFMVVAISARNPDATPQQFGRMFEEY
jgi:hypothetical protein